MWCSARKVQEKGIITIQNVLLPTRHVILKVLTKIKMFYFSNRTLTLEGPDAKMAGISPYYLFIHLFVYLFILFNHLFFNLFLCLFFFISMLICMYIYLFIYFGLSAVFRVKYLVLNSRQFNFWLLCSEKFCM